jgi:hypothetical protein
VSAKSTSVLAVVTCGVVVTVEETVTIPPLRPAAIIEGYEHRFLHIVQSPVLVRGFAGWSHLRVTTVGAANTVLLSLLGAVGLTRDVAPRAAADLAGPVAIMAHLRLPALLARYASCNRAR